MARGRAAFACLLLCLALGARSEVLQPDSCEPGPLPAVPGWAKKYRPDRERKPTARREARSNQQLVAEANAAGTRYDFILYGDSITSKAGYGPGGQAWGEWFGNLTSAPLGILGNTVEELAQRFMMGAERFEQEPRVVHMLIGINNLERWPLGETAGHLDALLRYMRAAMPRSQLVLLNLLPNIFLPVEEANARWQAAAEAAGWAWSTCGADIDPEDAEVLYDGIHPTGAGYDQLFACLRPEVEALLAAGDACGNSTAASSA